MKRTVLVHCVLIGWIVLVGLIAVSARAGEPAAKPEGDAQAKPPAEAPANVPEPVTPERKLEFEVSEEPYPQRVAADFLTDPKNQELRHVAVVRLTVPALPRVFTSSVERGDIPPGRRPIRFLAPYEAMPLLDERSGYFNQMRKGLSLPEDVLSELDRASLRVTSEGPIVLEEERPTQTSFSVEIRAPTAERARELVQSLFVLLDKGICYSAQRRCLLKEQTCREELSRLRDELTQQQAALAQLQGEREKLEEFQDLDKDALSGLKTQRRLIAVDVAGAKAQIDACTRILGDLARAKPTVASRLEQVEGLKIAAEIELVGLTARKNALDEIVEKGQLRLSLTGKMSEIGVKVRNWEEGISNVEEALGHIEVARNAYMPFPVRGKIVIRPIKWEVIEADKKK